MSIEQWAPRKSHVHPADECRHGVHWSNMCPDCRIMGLAATAKRAQSLRREQKRLYRVALSQSRAMSRTQAQLDAISTQLGYLIP